MQLALKFKSISSEQCEPVSKIKEAKQNANKNISDQKESNCWNLSIHVKIKEKKNLKVTNMMLTILWLG